MTHSGRQRMGARMTNNAHARHVIRAGRDQNITDHGITIAFATIYVESARSATSCARGSATQVPASAADYGAAKPTRTHPTPTRAGHAPLHERPVTDAYLV